MARRSGRLFADEYQPAHEMTPSDGYSPSIREQDEIHVDGLSRSRDSSLSLLNFGVDMCAGLTSDVPSREVVNCLGTVTTSEGNVDSRPINFGEVIPGLYRSGYPQADDHKYLKSLGLRTVVTLVQKDYPKGYQTFMESNGINHIVIHMESTKEVSIPSETIKSIMEVALDRRNYPILVHCNHGKHRTGCVVAVIRKVMGWHLESIIEEYATFAYPKARECDISYIQSFDITSLTQAVREPRDSSYKLPFSRALSRARMVRTVVMVLLVLGLWIFTTIQLRR